MDPFPLIRIEGDARARGRSYGRAAAAQIAHVLEIYRREFDRKGLGWSEAQALATSFQRHMHEYDPELTAEIEAIAEGARQSPASIVIINARTELLFWKAAQAGSAVPVTDVETEECTSAIALPEATRDGHTLHAQNWDWQPECAEGAVVLEVRHGDQRPDLLTCVEAGQLARHGLNSAGIGLTANGLHSGLDYGRFGVPNPIIRRRMLTAPTLARSLQALLNAPRAFSHNVGISDAQGEAFDMETTPEECFWLEPEAGILAHANHFRSPIARSKLRDANLARCPETLYRERRVRTTLQRARGSIDVELMKRVLADDYGAPDAVCRHPAPRPGGMISATVYTLIMDTTARTMWIAPLPYRGARFTEYALGG